MRFAALYDIHGNLPALEAVIADLQHERVDAVVIGGDVLPGPMPAESLAVLRALPMPVHCIRGNGDREVLGMRAGITPSGVPPQFHPMLAWTGEQLSSADVEWIASWPLVVTLPVSAGESMLFCHATPESDTLLFTSASSTAYVERLFASVEHGVVVCGHTHHQFRRAFSRGTVVNAGSVGMAITAAGAGRAEWLLLDDGVPQFRSTRYDITAAAERIRATSYPLADDFVQRSVLHPPLLHDMITLYTKAAEP